MKTIKGFVAFAGLTLVLAAAASAQVSLASLDGPRIDVESQRGKVVVLAIGASWLPLSAKQADFTNTLARKYAGRDVVFYFVSTDSATARSKNFASNEDIRRFASTNRLSIPILRDPDGASTLKRFSVDQVPSFVILDKSGSQAGEPYGGIDPKFDITVPLSRAIDKLL
jgi:hypothetical protein